MAIACHPSRKLFRGILAAALMISWSGFIGWMGQVKAADIGAGENGVKKLSESDRAKNVQTVERLCDFLAACDKASAAESDPAAIIARIGRDPQALLAWVQDNTYWVPYQGMLRNSTGVLLDRLGDSLDRALLLAELLKQAGFESRLARCRLDEKTASTALKKLRRVPSGWQSPAAQIPNPSNPELLKKTLAYASRFGVDVTLAQRGFEKAGIKASRMMEAIVSQSAEQAPALLELAGPATNPDREQFDRSELDAIADHWWVQIKLPNQDWTDYDPTLGTADASAVSRPAPQSVYARQADHNFAIPDENAHRVEIQVVAERSDGNNRTESVVLAKTLRPIDVLGRKVYLGHIPLNWPEGYEIYSGQDGFSSLNEAAQQPREWVPVLFIGTEVVTQSGVNADGSIDAKPPLDTIAQTGKSAVSAVHDVLSAFGSGPPEQKAAGEFTAERIDYRLLIPGRPVQVVSRYLFDLTGAAARSAGRSTPTPSRDATINRSLSLLGETEILLQPCAFSPDASAHMITQAVLANRGAIVEAAKTDFRDAKAVSEWSKKLLPVPGAVYTWATCRFTCSPAGQTCYLDQPSVVSSHNWLTQQGSDLTAIMAFDIVSNKVAVHRYSADKSYPNQLKQGVCDTIAESAVLHATEDCVRCWSNTSEAFGKDLSHKSKWIALSAKELAKLDSMQFPENVRANIRAEIQKGNQVILPETPPAESGSIVWWSIDPKSGQTLGTAANGWGATMGENALVLLRVLVKEAIIIACIGKALAGKKYAQAVLCYIVGGLGTAGVAAGGFTGGVLALVADIFGVGKIITG